MDIEAILDSSPLLALSALVFMVIQGAKQAGFPKKWLPLLAMAIGAIGYPALQGWTVANVFNGLVIGGAAVGLHQGFKQFTQGGSSDSGGKGAAAALLIGLSLLILPGCVSTPDDGPPPPEQRLELTTAFVQTSAQLGTYYALKEWPDARSTFEAATVVLDVALTRGQIEPERISAAIESADLGDYHYDVSMAVQAAIALYTAYYGEVMAAKLDQAVYVRPVLEGLRTGIELGLNARRTEMAYGMATE